MDATANEVLASNNIDSTVPEASSKEDVVEKTGVTSASEVTEIEKKETNEKEVSWEKIAAEIVDVDQEESVNKVEESQTQEASVESKSGEVEETVITSVTEEKTMTETEVVADSAEPLNESSEGHSVDEISTSVEEISTSVEEVEEIESKESKKSAETIVEETTYEEVTIEAVPVDEVVEDQEDVEQPSRPEVEISIEKSVDEKSKPEETIEITELKPEEMEETVENIEYTVVEAEEVETHEIIEEHIAQTNNTGESVSETVVIINPDQTQTEITIEQISEDERSGENSQSYSDEIYLVTKDSENVDDPSSATTESKQKPKKPRGRKPISDIPLHVLGRDITKPSEGVSNGGRTMPKPRLGVKVPYRNLTSQIVSKQEIEKEIMERFKLKQEQNATNSGDILFARKLTQRLAKKLIPTDKDKDTKPKEEKQEAGSSFQSDKSEIKNNSDLIAILEGDDDDIEIAKKKEEERKQRAKRTEREIALEQLKEFTVKPKEEKKVEKTVVEKKVEKAVVEKKKDEEKPVEKKKEEEKKVPQSQKETPKSKPAITITPSSQKKEEKKVDIEPRLKTGVVLKTYTRKRKSTEEPILPPKKSVVSTTVPIKTEDGSPSSVYITKSSRIIKRKVIWDPDEVPSKSPMKSPKIESNVKSPKTESNVKPHPIKTVEKKEPEKKEEKKVSSPIKKVIAKPSPPKKPKRLTEIDKLLMDEGAVNMLYDVKTNDESNQEKLKKKNKSVISLDRAHKELMSKTNILKNDLQQNTSKDGQKSLRKKEPVSPPKREVRNETPTPISKKKDSLRGSVNSPPSSPPFNAAEASRIIRRHSSSSFSSNEGLSDEDGEEKVSKKKSSTTVESAKKKVRKSSDAKPAKDTPKSNNTETKVNHVDKTVEKSKTFTVTRKNKLVSIKIQNVDGKCYFNEHVLRDLISSLKEYGNDDDCHVVSITSNNSESFCNGLDYSLLITDDDGARKKKATEVANLVKEFLRCLLNFPKVLVAGIQGDCIGLGVTMLPLFDIVIASDTATFSAPYARLGCAPEAGFLLSVPHLNSNGLASELLFTSQIIKADDAFRRGLVTRLCWPEKYHQEMKNILSQIANQSRQSIVATKQQLRQNIMQSTETALNSISKVLVEHWTSPECQKNFSK